MDLDPVLIHKYSKKELGQYPATMTSDLVNNRYICLIKWGQVPQYNSHLRRFPWMISLNVFNNYIVLYERWVPPTQYNAFVAGNPRNSGMSPHAVFHAPFTLSTHWRRGGGKQKDVDKTLQGPPHWNTLVQWRSALSLKYYTNTADQKYQLLFVVDFINIHNHACFVNWKSFLLVLHHFYLSCKKRLSFHLWCFTFLWKYKSKSRWGVSGHAHYPVPREYFHKSKHKKTPSI